MSRVNVAVNPGSLLGKIREDTVYSPFPRRYLCRWVAVVGGYHDILFNPGRIPCTLFLLEPISSLSRLRIQSFIDLLIIAASIVLTPIRNISCIR